MTQAQNKKNEPVPHEAFEDDDPSGLFPRAVRAAPEQSTLVWLGAGGSDSSWFSLHCIPPF